MLTLCYLIARCAGGARLAWLDLRQGKVMAGARTNAEGQVVISGLGVWDQRKF